MKIEFSTYGAAFRGEDILTDELAKSLECQRILRDITRKLENGCVDGPIMDINGNKIGRWEM